MLLHYIQGSPFARMARVLLREYGLACEERLIEEFPPSPAYFDVNPLGQVPALEDGQARLFPTSVVLAHLVRKAGHAGTAGGEVARTLARDGCREMDEQLLAVLLAMGDMMAMVQYLKWAGLASGGPNRLGFDPVERNQERVYRTLDWLEQRAGVGGFWPECIAVQDVVLACLMLWSDSRGPIAWRGRPRLESLVARLEGRPSFLATVPRPLPESFRSGS